MMVHPIQIFLNGMLDSGQRKRTVTALNSFDYYGEKFILIERRTGFRDVIVELSDFDTYEDIRQKIENHVAYY